MPDAHITQVAALPEFRSALATFTFEARQAMTDVQLEIRRALDWITHDRAAHWREEARRAQDAVTRAKDDLANSRTFKRIGDYVPACVDEKRALENAKRRLAHAEKKLAAVKYWSHAAPRAVDEFQGPVQQLMGLLDGDMPRAIAVLQRMTSALERYAATGVPVSVKWEELIGSDTAESAARAVDDSADDDTVTEQPADGTGSEAEHKAGES